jgi:3D (Asp-Asp-Asp) domain-containing protein
MENIEYTVDELRDKANSIYMMLDEFLKMFRIDTVELTGYAPLDPRAVEGMCFSGNPNITASGARVEIGTTVAAGRGIPFGTRVFVVGHGWRTVQDRGGMITNSHIDIAVATREEARAIGRRNATVIWFDGKIF